MGRFKRLNTPRKIIDRILNYPVKQRMLRLFPRPSINFAKEYFKNKPIKVTEIGVFRGENSNSIMRFLNIKEIYLIDPYTRYKEDKNDWNYNKIQKAEKVSKRRMKKYGEKIKFIKKYSTKAVKDIPLCDFIYIDGNHNYEYVKKDIELYSKKLSDKGILAGHDIQIHDVIKAVTEFTVKNPKYKLYVESLDWWLIK